MLSSKRLVSLAEHLAGCGDARKADVAGALIDAEIGLYRSLDEGEVDGGKPA